MDEYSTMDDYSSFTLCFGLLQVVGAIMLTVMGIWLSHYRQGFAWSSNLEKLFNWHPLLLTLGMIFLNGNSMLIYRAFRNMRKKTLKIIHAVIHATAFLCTVVGLQAVFNNHNLSNPPRPNMYSLHSWIGLGAVIIFVAQWLIGFLIFFYPSLDSEARAFYLPIHTYFGSVPFILACTTALLGITEKAIFSVPNYSAFVSESYIINGFGLTILLFMFIVLYLVSQNKYKRLPQPEDQMLLTAQKSDCCIPYPRSCSHSTLSCCHQPICHTAFQMLEIRTPKPPDVCDGNIKLES